MGFWLWGVTEIILARIMANGAASSESIGASARLSRVYKCDRLDLKVRGKPETRSLPPSHYSQHFLVLLESRPGSCWLVVFVVSKYWISPRAEQHVSERQRRGGYRTILERIDWKRRGAYKAASNNSINRDA